MNETVLYQLTETSPFMMSFVFKTAKGNAVVVDGGRPEDLPLLRKIVGKSPIRAWILTHPHVDHISGFTEVLKRNDFSLWPEKIYYHFPDLELIQREEPEQAYTLEEFLAVESRITNRKVTVREKDSFCIDELKITILQSYEPEQPIINESLTGNENSLVFRVDSPGKSVLFLGDTGPLGGDRLYQHHWEELKADLVQMAHHGHSGVGGEVYMAVRPEACLWCCPDWLYEEPPVSFGTRIWGTIMTRKWMEWLGVSTHYVTKDGTHRIVLFSEQKD